MRDLNRIISKKGSVVTKEVGDECIIVPLSDNIADMDSVFTLNDTGTFFWNLIDGKRTIADIIQAVVAEYDIDEKTVQKDLFGFFEEMSEWLEYVDPQK